MPSRVEVVREDSGVALEVVRVPHVHPFVDRANVPHIPLVIRESAPVTSYIVTVAKLRLGLWYQQLVRCKR